MSHATQGTCVKNKDTLLFESVRNVIFYTSAWKKKSQMCVAACRCSADLHFGAAHWVVNNAVKWRGCDAERLIY